MRTKVLICAALVAAGAISAVAQNVYSLNIVGYVNVEAKASYNILANPLSAGQTNGANEILPIIDAMTVLTFANNSYQYYAIDTGNWVGADGLPTQPPQLPPGKGFWFFNPGATSTNITFVGQVVPSPTVTNSATVAAGYSLLGSVMPVSGQAALAPNINATTGAPLALPPPGGINLPVLDAATYLPYNAASQSFGYFSFDTDHWVDATGATIASGGPTIAPGQGFFFFNPLAVSLQWQQALP